MWIKKELLEEALNNAEIFGILYAKTNESSPKRISPNSFAIRLRKGVETVSKDVAIVDYFRAKGYSDEEIFEQSQN